MKTKAKLILKSLADLPANALALTVSDPGHAIGMTKRVLTSPVRTTRRQIRAARQRSVDFLKYLYAQANTPMKPKNSWVSGGLNE